MHPRRWIERRCEYECKDAVAGQLAETWLRRRIAESFDGDPPRIMVRRLRRQKMCIVICTPTAQLDLFDL